MKRLAWLLILLCGGAAAQQPLTVSAAASLGDAFRALGPGFEARHPGAQIRLNTGASGQLLQQIVNGAPVDVLASADELTIEQGVVKGVLDGASRRVFAVNALVMVIPAQGPAVRDLEGLRHAAVRRIALGKPATVPAGRYAQAQLTQAGLWPVLLPKLVLADNVRQVLDYVARGEVEAGFVYRSDARSQPGRVRVALGFPEPIAYPIALVRNSRQPALAQAFIAYLGTPQAQAVLAQHGFGPPLP